MLAPELALADQPDHWYAQGLHTDTSGIHYFHCGNAMNFASLSAIKRDTQNLPASACAMLPNAPSSLVPAPALLAARLPVCPSAARAAWLPSTCHQRCHPLPSCCAVCSIVGNTVGGVEAVDGVAPSRLDVAARAALEGQVCMWVGCRQVVAGAVQRLSDIVMPCL